MSLMKLPLMPLNTVVFPGMPIPLALSEPHYLQMAQYCAEEDREFGIVLIREGAEVGDQPVVTHNVGTTAAIAQVRDVGDHIMMFAVGRRRFRIVRMIGEDPYPQAEVQLLEDRRRTRVSCEFIEDMRAAFAEQVDLILQLLGLEGTQLEIPQRADKLSYMIAAHLRVDLAEKQQLLEMDDTRARLAHEIETMRREIKEYRLLLAAREQLTDTDAGNVFGDSASGDDATGPVFSNN